VSNPSEPLLAWLRDIIGKKKLNSAGVADLAKIPKARVRKILVGSESMTVDELLRLCEVLHVTPADMGIGEQAVPKKTPEVGTTASTWHLDSFGNHPKQLFQMGFALGCDFLFLADTQKLEDSQIPEKVRAQHAGRNMAIRLDAAYHQYNEPEYYDEGIQITLSFDALYRCRFPWDCISQFVFYPDPSVGDEKPPPEPEKEPTPEEEVNPKVSHLRLLK
jgi:hypothetical protein